MPPEVRRRPETTFPPPRKPTRGAAAMESLHGRCFKHEYGCIFRDSLPIVTTFELGRKDLSLLMSTILPYLLVLFLAVWTAKVAMSRGRNPWIWGGAALLLGLLPWNFLGVLPLLLMLFMPRTNIDPQTRLQRLACSKCANTHRPGQRFCTNCGWDLTEVYTPEGAEHYNIPAPVAPMVEDSIAGVETAAARSADASAVREVEPSPSKNPGRNSPVRRSPPDGGRGSPGNCSSRRCRRPGNGANGPTHPGGHGARTRCGPTYGSGPSDCGPSDGRTWTGDGANRRSPAR